MILVIDALNKHKFPHIMDEMFRLRARVFGDRMGWDVTIKNGMERDKFDDMDPSYAVGLDDEGRVVSCVRALQTTGPHMLADVFSAILNGEPPLRSATIWESTRFCVDTKRLGRGKGRSSVSYATCELMIASLEAAKEAGVTDIVTVIDPLMDRILKRSGNTPYGYVGKQADMGKVPALAALLDCTEERIARIRAFAEIHHDVFIAEDEILAAQNYQPAAQPARSSAKIIDLAGYCTEQIDAALTEKERGAALALQRVLFDKFHSTRACNA
ncbi:acyl-homoserine-lactone synthase [uncultured Roseovarius sp.]|uniref:acyl-homoserine-lactone synthase n=1 Tax=uncultured Roseovarius sp. TaxID=293344 RepID=UPI002619B6FB|nr:acyl-homoserine-lactone synthase [uncultured Roseovarius sp.]